MMNRYISLIVTALFFFVEGGNIGGVTPGVAARHVFDIHALCGEAVEAGSGEGVKMVTIPITGGRIEGAIDGEIVPGGADYQRIDTVSSRIELNAVYSIMTCDSCFIKVRNRGININDADGYYFATSPEFEAPKDSKYNWLNNRIFVCKPIGFGEGIVHLRVWTVE